MAANFMYTSVYKVPMKAPDDTSAVLSLIKEKKIQPIEIVAILCKTEGNGNVNDFSRALATQSFEAMLTELTSQPRHIIRSQIALVMSGGCEGVMSPHATIFTRKRLDSRPKLRNKSKRLAIGVAFTRDFKPEEIGRIIQVKEVSNAVRKAMTDASIANTENVHFVQIKCPLLTSDQIAEAHARGKEVVTTDTLKSMAYSRGASALGVAIALGEIDSSKVRDEIICKDWRYFSNVASSSAGIELTKCAIILMGNSYYSNSDFVIGHNVMKDAIDSKAVFDSLKSVNIVGNDWPIFFEEKQRIVNIFAKAGASPDGLIRGRRHTMLTDSDISSTRHARAVVSAVIASIIGDPMIYVSGGSEHQGPAGGGPIAVIAREKT